MLTPYYAEDGITIYHAHAEDVVRILEPSNIDLVLTDPPYGSGLSMDFADRFKNKAGAWWKNTDRSMIARHAPVVGDDIPFDPSPLLVFRRLVLWGGNWYASRLPDSGGWIVWDKRDGVNVTKWPMSSAELAWTNLCKATHIFRHQWFGLLRASEHGQHYHPTQKPVALMAWIIEKWTRPDDLIFDPYMGSGPVLVAAKLLRRRVIGVEISEKYCEIAVNRLRQSVLPLEYSTVTAPDQPEIPFD